MENLIIINTKEFMSNMVSFESLGIPQTMGALLLEGCGYYM